MPKWIAELNSNLIVYYVMLQLLGVGVALLLRSSLGVRFALLVAALLSVFSWAQIGTIQRFGTPKTLSSEPGLLVISADVAGDAHLLSDITAEIPAQGPAVLGVSGVSAAVAAELPRLLPEFAVVLQVLREDGFGLALLARGVTVEPRGVTVGEGYEELPPVLRARIAQPGAQPIEVALLRLPPPLSQKSWQITDLVTRRVLVPLRTERSTFIVFGNLNITPTSNFYRRAVWATQARSAMEGFGYLRSCCFPSAL
ncbi:MAG: endonuclease/exonuclease/phosphatase family protein, partial [Proteobacteria bacterium]|nr:endonuclease/exonuclease/phosphatase family protein [Pseudomonadota bacterium]